MNTTCIITRSLVLIASLLLSVAFADPSTNVPPTITPTAAPVPMSTLADS